MGQHHHELGVPDPPDQVAASHRQSQPLADQPGGEVGRTKSHGPAQRNQVLDPNQQHRGRLARGTMVDCHLRELLFEQPPVRQPGGRVVALGGQRARLCGGALMQLGDQALAGPGCSLHLRPEYPARCDGRRA